MYRYRHVLCIVCKNIFNEVEKDLIQDDTYVPYCTSSGKPFIITTVIIKNTYVCNMSRE